MKELPNIGEAEKLLAWALSKNPGQWGAHSRTVARAARTIALACRMNAQRCEVLGLLHDIGRYVGKVAFTHVVAGYDLMMLKGYPSAAKVCLTHSFPLQDIAAYNGQIDCAPQDFVRVKGLLAEVEYDDEMRLIQLCDAISLPTGVTIMETRLLEVGLRHGLSQITARKWQTFMELKALFDRRCGQNIYQLFSDEITKDLFS